MNLNNQKNQQNIPSEEHEIPSDAEQKNISDCEQNETPDNLTDQDDENQTERDKANAALSEMSDKYLRLVAEFDNFRKRNAKERNELIKNAGEDVITSLLDILDDADRAENQIKNASDSQSIQQGMTLIFNKLRNILTAKGLKKMTCLGEEFNPELHDAITEVPANSKEDKGKIIDDVQSGYYLNDKIIRHAKVVVGK